MSSGEPNKKRKISYDGVKSHEEELEAEIVKLKAKNDKLQAENDEVKAKNEQLQAQLLDAAANRKHDGVDEEESSDDDESVVDSSNDPWNVMLNQLREYRSIHGHCKVPFKFPSNPKLGFWVGMQRKKHKKGELSQDRVDKLDHIDFFWGKDFPPRVSWEERFEEAEKYQQQAMGDVPVNPSNPTPLAKWVSQQRKEYKRTKKGAPSLLSLEQIEKLNGIGFNWKGPRLP